MLQSMASYYNRFCILIQLEYTVFKLINLHAYLSVTNQYNKNVIYVILQVNHMGFKYLNT